MDNDPKFMERFLGLVQGVKSGSLNLQIDTDEVTVSVGDNSITDYLMFNSHAHRKEV
jgi:hypothetical protein